MMQGVETDVREFLLVVAYVLAGLLALAVLSRAGMAAARSRLRIAGFEGCDQYGGQDLACAAMSQLRVEMKRLTGETTTRVDLATGAAAEFTLPSRVVAELPQSGIAAAIVQLVERALPANDLTVSGCFQPEDARGIGLTLSLADRTGSVFRTTTLREHDHGTAASAAVPNATASGRCLRLMVAAAVWTLFATQERQRVSTVPTFGVTNWLSFALASVAAVNHSYAVDGTTRRMYMRALDLEPTNRLARFDVAIHDLRAAPPDDETALLRAIDQFRLVQDQSVNRHLRRRQRRKRRIRCTCPVYRDGLWFRAKYHLALCQLMLADRLPGAAADRSLEKAQRNVAELVTQLTHVHRKSDPEEPIGRRRYSLVMTDFATQFRPQLLIMAAGILLRGPEHAPQPTEALRTHMRCADVTPRAVIQHVEADPRLNYRARYNLACFYARLIAQGDDEPNSRRRALTELQLSLEVSAEDLIDWAMVDPALAPLREHEETGPKFWELVDGVRGTDRTAAIRPEGRQRTSGERTSNQTISPSTPILKPESANASPLT